jgi:MraZ protein
VPTTNLIGEYECRLDDKSRIILPAALKKQISQEAQDKFVVNRGFEGCLVLYPQNVWDETTARMNKLNLFIKDNRQFVRAFNNGATPLLLDSQNRLLLPKTLLDYASIDREIILFAYSDRIEVWNKKTYREMLSNEPEDFAQLAEKVMGNQNITSAGDDLP